MLRTKFNDCFHIENIFPQLLKNKIYDISLKLSSYDKILREMNCEVFRAIN